MTALGSATAIVYNRDPMPRFIFLTVIVVGTFAAGGYAQQAPAADLVQGFVDAYNKQDLAYFERMLAPDAVVPDDDGHILVDRAHMIDLFRRRFSVTPPDKLTASTVVTRSAADVSWASFAYTFNHSGDLTKGLITLIFTRSGNDWRIAHIHYSIDIVPNRSR